MSSAQPIDYAHDDGLLVDKNEAVLMRRVGAGIIGGMVFFSMISIILMQVSTGWGWGSSIVVGIFGGFWAGLFFGAAAGNAVHIIKSGNH
jgi:hypothetical protein